MVFILIGGELLLTVNRKDVNCVSAATGVGAVVQSVRVRAASGLAESMDRCETRLSGKTSRRTEIESSSGQRSSYARSTKTICLGTFINPKMHHQRGGTAESDLFSPPF